MTEATPTPSPWLDSSYDNIFRREMTLAAENSDFPGFEPELAYVWLHKNGVERHLYKAVAKCAPLFPVRSYRGEVSSWVSPPPSGGGNRICLVVGKDATGMTRIVGGNYFHSLDMPEQPYVSGPAFFGAYDIGNARSNHELIRQATANWYGGLSFSVARNLDDCCDWGNAMPIYITVLDDELGMSLFTFGPALLGGLRPADFDYEYFGEIAP